MRIISILFVLLFASAPVWAGSGSITGTVTDEKNGETIVGATVVVKGTTNGTVTDIDGKFTLAAEAGTYTLEIKYVGYKSKEVDDVEVKEGAPSSLNITLGLQKRTELNEVTVRSSFKKENINALYTIQKNSATIQDGISADVIKKSPDRSTGEVLKRVSGTTIQDNKFVIVRGLSDRYNTALVDNAILPSTEPNRKAFSFDIIPAALIDNITITKAGTPDLPGDFAGGVINILTKEVPDQNFTSVSLGGTYNTVSTGKKFQSGYRTGTDILGFDDGSRQLPKSFPSTTDLTNRNPTTAESITYLNKLNNNFEVKEHSALPGINLQALIGRAYHSKNNDKFGFTAGITYTHNESIRPDLQRTYGNFDYKDQVYIYSTSLGAVFNAGYSTGKSKYTFKALYNRLFDDQFLYREGQNYANGTDIRYYAYDLIQKSLLKFSLEGDHQVGKGQSKLNWLVAFNNVTNNQPDQRKVSYGRSMGTSDVFMADNTTLGKANSRLFGNLNENIMNANVNYSAPVKLFDKSTIKAGVSGQYRYRDFDNRYLGAVLNSAGQTTTETNVRALPVDQLNSTTMIDHGYYDIADGTTPGDKYNATATTAAGYVMMDNKVNDKVRVVWGVRAEQYDLNLKSNDIKVTKSWLDILPSAHFTYSLNTKSNLRASYFRSVIRPELREVAGELTYYDYELNATVVGNSSLQRCQVDNADLRYEIYPSAGEIFSASVFYKRFNNTIENSLYGANSSYEVSTQNFGVATNIGVELEIRKKLGFIAPNTFMKNLNFYANLALIQSKVPLEGVYRFSANFERDSRPLAGQSPYVINTSLGYTSNNEKFSANVLYNRIGQRIYLVGQGQFADVYEMPRNLLDLQLNYTFSKRSEVRLNVKDLLNAPVKFYFDQNNDKKYNGEQDFSKGIDPNKDYLMQEYRPGTSFTLSYIFKF